MVKLAARSLMMLVAGCLFPFVLSAQAPGEVDPVGVHARILPGDQIGLRIFREPELSGAFTVSEAGEVVLPKLGVVHVADRTAGGLQESLREAYAAYLRNPSIEVTVLRRVGVLGEVRQPNLYMVDLTMSVRDIVAKAGGVTPSGDPNKISIVRDGEEIRLGSMESMVTAELRSGDEVVVGRRHWLTADPLATLGTGVGLISFFVTVILPLVR